MRTMVSHLYAWAALAFMVGTAVANDVPAFCAAPAVLLQDR